MSKTLKHHNKLINLQSVVSALASELED